MDRAVSFPTKDYYVSNSGNDRNSGTSPSRPWKTVSKVNKSWFSPGSIIHFKCGDVWREQLIAASGNAGGYVTYTSYGSGPKPLFLGSVNLTGSFNWTPVGKNLWTISNPRQKFYKDVGNIIFNNGDAFGIKVFSKSELNTQNKFYYDKANYTIVLFSAQNPGSIYSSIECAITQNIIEKSLKAYVKFDGLALKYGSAHGVGGYDNHHMIVQNCDFSFIGGGELYNDGTPVRYGGGIEFYNNAHDCYVTGCNFYEIYDTAITAQGAGDKIQQYNLFFRNNYIEKVEWSYEGWVTSDDGFIRDIYFENNICKGAGLSWGHAQRPNLSGIHILLNDSTAPAERVYVRNNKIEIAADFLIYLSIAWKGEGSVILGNNQYVVKKNSLFAVWKDVGYMDTDFEAFKRDANDYGSTLTTI